MRQSAQFLFMLMLAGCVGAARPIVVKPEWLPPKGKEWAVADCEAKAAGVGGYDWIDAALSRGKAYGACLKAYGIEMQTP